MLYKFLRKKFPYWLANTLIVIIYAALILAIYLLIDYPTTPFRYQR